MTTVFSIMFMVCVAIFFIGAVAAIIIGKSRCRGADKENLFACAAVMLFGFAWAIALGFAIIGLKMVEAGH